MRFLLASTLLALVCLTSGCDVFGDTTRYSGTVVDDGTGEPLEGIYVTIRTIPSLGHSTMLASTFTDAEGRYKISQDGSETRLYANYIGLDTEGAYNSDYNFSTLRNSNGVIRLIKIR